MKIKHLKSNMKQHQAKPVLFDDEVKTYFKSSHRKFVIVKMDKAVNNYAVICKRFYASIVFLLKLEYLISLMSKLILK